MTHSWSSLFGVAALAASALGGCAAPPGAGGGGVAAASPGQAPPPGWQSPGPGWLLLGSNEDGAVYMHPRSTLRVGSSAFIMLVGSKREPVVLPGGVSVGSIRERVEIDCDKRRYRRHDGTAHPDRVALGPVLGQVGQQEQWRGVNPNTVIDAVASAVCAATAPGTAAPPDLRGVPPLPALPPLLRNRRQTFST